MPVAALSRKSITKQWRSAQLFAWQTQAASPSTLGYVLRTIDVKMEGATPPSLALCSRLDCSDLVCAVQVPTQFQAGDCFLSYDNRATVPKESFRSISQLDYFERRDFGEPEGLRAALGRG